MPTPSVFPQIGSTKILTQLPYKSGYSFDTVTADLETGMRWSFSRRGNTDLDPDLYSLNPLGTFALSFQNITDAEVTSLRSFFDTVKGRWNTWRLFDPGGNLIQHSEDLSSTEWDKTNGVTIVGVTSDPFNNSSARGVTVQATGSNSLLLAPIGPADGYMNGFVVNVSVWARARSIGQSLFIGVVDSGFSTLSGNTVQVPYNSWKRISATAVLWNSNYFRMIVGGYGTWASSQIDFFGFQAVAMKGEGPYVKTPGNYGYHQNVRFDVDDFEVRVVGPNQNTVQLPCVEVNGS